MINKRHLDSTRSGLTKHATIGDKKIYITTGEFSDGSLGELFIRIDKEGSILRSYDSVAIAVSIGLQNGIPLSEYTDKLIGQIMEPRGITNDHEIPIAKSITDYVFRWLDLRYGKVREERCKFD